MFTKNITTDSPVQKLSSAAENLIAKQGILYMAIILTKNALNRIYSLIILIQN